jgi:hypothetical protein
MPALNIDFTDEELAHVRERARSRGLAMRAYAHDVIVNCTDSADKDDRVMAAMAEVISLSEDVLSRLADL